MCAGRVRCYEEDVIYNMYGFGLRSTDSDEKYLNTSDSMEGNHDVWIPTKSLDFLDLVEALLPRE